MDIIKQLDGTVIFKRSGQILHTLQEDVTANLIKGRNGVLIKDILGKKAKIYTSQIENTQLLPAVAIKFVGGTVDLWNVLFDTAGSPFFTELHMLPASGSGGVIESNWTIINTGTYTALITDYQFSIEINTVITLPTIAVASIGRVYRFSAVNFTATINTGGANVFVDGSTSIILKKYEFITLRAKNATTWAWAD